MNFKTTYILFGILVVVLGIFLVAVWKGSTEITNTTYVLQSMHDPAAPMKPEQVDKVEIKRERPAAETIVFQRDSQSKRWRITQPRELRANSGAVDNLINQVYDAHREEHVDMPTSLAQWGLDPPAAVITLWKGDRSVSLDVGNSREGVDSGVVYVTSSDQPKEGMAVKKNQLDSVFKKLVDFRSRDLLATSTYDIKAVTLSEGKKGPLELKKTTGDRWRYVKPDYGYAESEGATGAPEAGKPPRNVNALLTAIANLKVEYKDEKDNDFVADDVSDLHKYNLDPATDPILRIEVQRSEEGGKSSTAALLVGVGKKVGTKYYARLDGEKSVVKVSAKDVEPMVLLLGDEGALRDRSLVDLGFKTPDALDVQFGTTQLRFRKAAPAKPWRLYYGSSDTEHEVDTRAVEHLLAALTGKDETGRTRKDLVLAFPTGTAAQYGLDKPEAVVKVWTGGVAAEKNNDKKDQKKSGEPKLKEPNKPTVELRFGKVDKDKGQVYVERKRADEAKGTTVAVSDKLLDEVRQGPLTYLDKALPQFSPGTFPGALGKDVTRLELKRKDGTWVLTHGTKADEPWKIEKPTDLAGRNADRTAVQDILAALNTIRAIKLITLKSSNLKEYGLAEPQAKAVVTVTKDGKSKTYAYEFGKEAKEGVFAKQGWLDTIFTTSAGIVTALNAELRDPTVFAFDVAKVQRVKLEGWIALQRKVLKNEPFVLEVERKGASQWVPKTPAGFKVDASKLRRFLEELSRLRAESFLGKRAPKPDEDLDIAKGALVIELTVEKEKEPLRLTVGKLDGDKGYFAISNKMPGEVFLVRKEIFKEPKSEPGYFSTGAAAK